MSYSLGTSQAVFVLVFVGDKLQQGMFEFVPTRAIAESLSIPTPTVAKIVRALTQHGLLEAREGVRGGVRLGKPPSKITLDDVLRAIEQKRPLFAMHGGVRARGERPTRAERAIAAELEAADEAMHTRLAETSLATLLARVAGAPRESTHEVEPTPKPPRGSKRR